MFCVAGVLDRLRYGCVRRLGGEYAGDGCVMGGDGGCNYRDVIRGRGK